MLDLTYILPLRSEDVVSSEFSDYVNGLAAMADVVVVDGSRDAVFRDLGSRLQGVRHIRPHSDFAHLLNGKVRGVLTGVRVARHELMVIADDDVRHTRKTLEAVAHALGDADAVIPQNYFQPLPWHARFDTARTLINRMTGGDWPGTLGVRRSTLRATGGYDGNVLFENLELIRTIEAARGRVVHAPSLFVRRLPPPTRHFWTQRVRQAYDEFARPGRLLAALAVLPLEAALIVMGRWWEWVAICIVGPFLVAESGRRAANGRDVFPLGASFCAPLWVIERGVCAWMSLERRLLRGGITYGGRVVKVAGHSVQWLTRRRPAPARLL
jgi:hypothetical protein